MMWTKLFVIMILDFHSLIHLFFFHSLSIYYLFNKHLLSVYYSNSYSWLQSKSSVKLFKSSDYCVINPWNWFQRSGLGPGIFIFSKAPQVIDVQSRLRITSFSVKYEGYEEWTRNSSFSQVKVLRQTSKLVIAVECDKCTSLPT